MYTKIISADRLLGSDMVLRPDRGVSYDPVSEQVDWTMDVEFEDERARELTAVPVSALRLAIRNDAAPVLSIAELLGEVSAEHPDHIRLDANVLFSFNKGSGNEHVLFRSMNDHRIERVCSATIIRRPDRPRDRFLPCFRHRKGKDTFQRDRVPVWVEVGRQGFLVLAPS